MTGKELVGLTLDHQNTTGKNAFWVGTPTGAALKAYSKRLGMDLTEDIEFVKGDGTKAKVHKIWRGGKKETDFYKAIGCDIVRIRPDANGESYKHPLGKRMWECYTDEHVSMETGNIFADCEDVSEIENFEFWPNPDYLDMSKCIEDTKYAYDQGMVIFGSMVTSFFHNVSNFFGMESYFIKMYTNPEIVHAVTRRVTDFYLETNKRYIQQAKQYLTAGFFSLDFGTQLAPLVGPGLFDEFILPYLRELIDQFKSEGLKFALHSCGAIDPLIPCLIDAGVDILNPLQAKAVGMDAENLAKKYGGKLIFMGGIDAQELLPLGTPEQIREEVLRLRDLFKGDFIVSPSHDALLPDVPFENMMAMSLAARE